MPSPSRDEFRALAARAHRRAGVARGARRPRHAGRRLRQARRATSPGFLLESVEHGERWSRFSFVGRDPSPRSICATAPRRRRRRRCPPASRSTEGMLAALEALLRGLPVADRSPTCRRCTAASMGYLGYDVVREVERLPDVPPDDHGTARRGDVASSAQLAAFDHWRQRVYADRERAACSELRPTPSSTPPTTRRSAASTRAVADLAPPARRTPLVEPPAARRRAARRAHRRCADGMYQRRGRGGQGAHPRRRHLPGRARAALRPRPRRRSVRRLPRAAPGEPEPVHVLPAPPRGHDRRLVARADGAAARRQGDLAADRRHPPPRPRPTSTTGAWPAS